MKIAVFRAKNLIGAAWAVTGGITSTLRKMGHTVFDVDINGALPDFYQLVDKDIVIVSGMEWSYGTLDKVYGNRFKGLNIAAIYHETLTREDRVWDFNEFEDMAAVHFFPSVQDAEKYKGDWLPFGVDTDVFKPVPEMVATRNCGFIGSVYPKREPFLSALAPLVTRIVSPFAEDELHTNLLLAHNYQTCKVFVNLPSLSQLLVTKVYEVMACGVPLLTPLLTGDAVHNMQHFQSTGHLEYYDESNPAALKERIKYMIANPSYSRLLAQQGLEEIRRYHTLEQRMTQVLERFK
jgi:glycosyltransferase involved in cell wall biosynthesis